jgi:polyhydroxybutyrate depolymerase
VKGKAREYRIIVPKSVDPQKPAPLVFAYHGLLDSKDLMPIYSQLDKLAEAKGFILIFPNGLNRHWPLIPQLAVDDVAFFDALYAFAAEKYNIDLNRVYVTGMSNGAYFSNLLAYQRADKIAAIAPHSGGLGALSMLKDLDVKPKYAVLIIHGASDSIVPVSEGQKQRDAYTKWGHAVEYVEVPNFNHLWAHNIDVNAKIWAFFEKHPLQPVTP